MVNIEFILAGCVNLMERNYNVNRDLIDLESLIDGSLSMATNWFKIKPKVLLLSPKNTFLEGITYNNEGLNDLYIQDIIY